MALRDNAGTGRDLSPRAARSLDDRSEAHLTPHLDDGKGTFILDVRLGKLGRMKRASGTTDPRLFTDVKTMIRMLRKSRRWEVLALLANGHVAPLELHDAFVRGELDELPSADDLRLLRGTVDRWLETLDRAPATAKQYRWLLAQLGSGSDTLAHVPTLLQRARQDALRSGKRTLFNNLASAVRMMLAWAVGDAHRLYMETARVEALRVERRKGNPQSLDDLRALATRLGNMGPMAWALALTGMRRGEYFGRRFEVLADRIAVHGTKSKAADRVVFLPYPVTAPLRCYDHFRRVLSDVSGARVIPHDLRYTFKRWGEDAGIPERRLKWYMGHAVKDVSDLYSRGRGFTEYLVTDAGRMRDFLGERPAMGLEVLR